MATDSSGNYSLPSGYLAVTGQTVLASQHNGPLEDIATALTARLPRNGTAAMQANLPMGGFKATNMGNGTADSDAATYGQLTGLIPAGVILDYAGSTAPSGWLLCYGQAISRSTYATLFSTIGTTYGVGDGSTTFNLPDLRGRIVAGKDNMGGTSADRLTNQTGGLNGDTLGATGGSETHTLTDDEMPEHTHTGTTSANGAHTHTINKVSSNGSGDGVWGNSTVTGSLSTSSSGSHSHTFTTESAGSGEAHNNVQPTIILNKIIRTGA